MPPRLLAHPPSVSRLISHGIREALEDICNHPEAAAHALLSLAKDMSLRLIGR